MSNDPDSPNPEIFKPQLSGENQLGKAETILSILFAPVVLIGFVLMLIGGSFSAVKWGSVETELRSDGSVQVEQTRWWFKKHQTVFQYNSIDGYWKTKVGRESEFSRVERTPFEITPKNLLELRER